MKVSDALTSYLKSIDNPTTRANYKIALIDFLGGIPTLKLITKQKIEDYKESLQSPQTAASRLAAIRSFMDYCWTEGWTTGDPSLSIKNNPVAKYSNAKNIALEDFQKLLLSIDSSTSGLRDNLMLRLLYFTGSVDKILRIGWHATLPKSLDGLRQAYITKLSKYLMTHTDIVWDDIKDGIMFFALEPRVTPDKPLSKSGMRKILQKYALGAGFEATHVDFQALKRLRAAEIWKKTKSVERVQEFCEHKSIKITRAYLKTLQTAPKPKKSA